MRITPYRLRYHTNKLTPAVRDITRHFHNRTNARAKDIAKPCIEPPRLCAPIFFDDLINKCLTTKLRLLRSAGKIYPLLHSNTGFSGAGGWSGRRESNPRL